MNLKLIYTGVVSDVIKIHRSKEMREAILRNFAGKKIRITIERETRKRSLSQNAYIHILFNIFAGLLNELGNDFEMEEVKEMMKFKFLKCDVVNEETGEKIGERIRHTSELSTTDFNLFIDQVIQYAAEEFSFQLPYPGEQININL